MSGQKSIMDDSKIKAIFSFSCFLAAGWIFVHRSSLIVHSPAGAGLGQTLGYWTVPAPGALFVTGGRFWSIIRKAQVRTGKVLALREWVGW